MSSSPAALVPGPATAPTERPGAGDPLLGEVLDGRYKLEAKIGEGGLGTVYRALHLKLERPVAIKVLKAELRAVPDIRQRFLREVRTLAALSHPSIVTITDYGEAGSVPYLVMELVEGDELSKLIGNCSPERALSVIEQVLSSLAYAHTLEVVHRDLKPANVIVRSLPDGKDHVVVLDFGLAKFVGDDSSPAHDLTRSGLVVGTPAYLPPEQIGGGAKKSEPRSDLYAVGLILYELLTGRRPFVTDDAAEMLRAHLSTKPSALTEAAPGATVAPALEALIQRALEKSPADRFPNAKAMMDAIAALPSRPMVRAGSSRESTDEIAMSSVEIELDSKVAAPAPRRPSGLAIAGALVVAFGLGVGLSQWALAPAPTTGTLPVVASAEPTTPAASPPAPAPEPEPAPEPVVVAEVEEPSEPVEPVDGTAPASDEGDLVEDPTGEDVGLVLPASRPASRDPWSARLPRELARFRQAFVRNGMTNRELRNLTRYRNEHALDIRPRLLLGHAYVRRGWLNVALDQYERALSRDLSCRGDPDLLPALVRVARSATLAARAANMIVAAYGSEAQETVDHAIERERDDGARGRLLVLRARLE